jgi:uracil-DNA glycosylase
MADTLKQVNSALKKKFSGKKLIVGQGFDSAKIVFVCDAPTTQELSEGKPFLKEELKTIKPDIVVTLGPTALNGVGLRLPLDNAHGRVFNMGSYDLIPTFHPAHAEKDQWVSTLITSDFMKLKDHIRTRKNPSPIDEDMV